MEAWSFGKAIHNILNKNHFLRLCCNIVYLKTFSFFVGNQVKYFLDIVENWHKPIGLTSQVKTLAL